MVLIFIFGIHPPYEDGLGVSHRENEDALARGKGRIPVVYGVKLGQAVLQKDADLPPSLPLRGDGEIDLPGFADGVVDAQIAVRL